MANTENTGKEMASVSFGRRRSDMVGLRKVAADDIIMVDGKYGLFTPLTSAETAESDLNLEEIIEVLRAELATTKQQNAQLRQQLEEATKKPPRTPDDFVTAIKHSVDSLQGKLSEMQNPISDFVVSEFNIDTRVFVDVTELGTINYRFIQPGDDLDPMMLSRLNLKIQPVPKETTVGTFDRINFSPYSDVDDIQGIGEVYKSKLKERNIYTVSDLLHVGTRARARVELSSMLEVEQEKLAHWLGQAELMTVRDIDGRAAEVLAEIGIDSLAQLAVQDKTDLTSAYNEKVAQKDHEVLKPIEETRAASWILSAQTYVGRQKKEAPAVPVETPEVEPAES